MVGHLILELYSESISCIEIADRVYALCCGDDAHNEDKPSQPDAESDDKSCCCCCRKIKPSKPNAESNDKNYCRRTMYALAKGGLYTSIVLGTGALFLYQLDVSGDIIDDLNEKYQVANETLYRLLLNGTYEIEDLVEEGVISKLPPYNKWWDIAGFENKEEYAEPIYYQPDQTDTYENCLHVAAVANVITAPLTSARVGGLIATQQKALRSMLCFVVGMPGTYIKGIAKSSRIVFHHLCGSCRKYLSNSSQNSDVEQAGDDTDTE